MSRENIIFFLCAGGAFCVWDDVVCAVDACDVACASGVYLQRWCNDKLVDIQALTHSILFWESHEILLLYDFWHRLVYHVGNWACVYYKER